MNNKPTVVLLWKRKSLSRFAGVFYSLCLATFLSGFAIYCVVDRNQRATFDDSVALIVVTFLGWCIVAFSWHSAMRAQRTAESGTPAISADAGGLVLAEMDRPERRVIWDQVDGFHISRSHGSRALFVEGGDPESLSPVAVFPIAELEGDVANAVAALEALHQSHHGLDRSDRRANAPR